MKTNTNFLSYLAQFFLERDITDKRRENQNTHFIFNNIFLKIVPFEIKWKNILQPDKPQTTIKYGACALHAG
jgi:hypothetical protein